MEEDEDPLYEDLQPFELVCTVCKGTDFIEADFIKTCADCGTQVRGHIEEQNHAEYGEGTGRSVKQKRKRTEKVYEAQVELRPSAELGFEAFQCVLQALVGALVSECGCDAEVASEVRALWFRVVPLCAEAVAETAHLYHVPSIAARGKRGVNLGPALALALCYLGCLRCALPVRVEDLLAWVRADVLPLMSAHLALPARLQPVARWLPSMVGMGPPTSGASVRKVAAQLVHKLELSLPPPPADKVVARLGAMLGLPPRVLTLATTLLLLAEHTIKVGEP